MADFTKSIESDPGFTEAYYYRARSYRNLGQYAEVIKDFRAAIGLDLEHADAYN